MNISQDTINAVYEVVAECFQCNRKFDRMVSVLNTKFACNQSANLIHQHIAHFFPVFSDMCGEKLLERYNISVEYGATDEGKRDYDNVTQIINTGLDTVIDFQNMFAGAMLIALNNKDMQVYADMTELMQEINPIVEQMILLQDKVTLCYKDNIGGFDHDIKSFWVLGE